MADEDSECREDEGFAIVMDGEGEEKRQASRFCVGYVVKPSAVAGLSLDSSVLLTLASHHRASPADDDGFSSTSPLSSSSPDGV